MCRPSVCKCYFETVNDDHFTITFRFKCVKSSPLVLSVVSYLLHSFRVQFHFNFKHIMSLLFSTKRSKNDHKNKNSVFQVDCSAFEFLKNLNLKKQSPIEWGGYSTMTQLITLPDGDLLHPFRVCLSICSIYNEKFSQMFDSEDDLVKTSLHSPK